MTSSTRALILAGLTALAGGLGGERAEAVCGCTQMTVYVTGGARTLCSNQNLNFPKCTKTPAHGAGPCAAYTYQYDRPVGSTNQSSTENHYGFVAEAQIAGGSTLSDTDQEKDVAAEQARWKYQFVSFVKGSGPSSCACFFEVDLNWAANAAQPVVAVSQLPGSTSCTVQ